MKRKKTRNEPPPEENRDPEFEPEPAEPPVFADEADDRPVVRSTPRCPYCGGYWPFEDEYCPECGMSTGDGVPSESE